MSSTNVEPLYKGAIVNPEQSPLYTKNALEYWHDEIALKAKGTQDNYNRYFADFLAFLSKPEFYNRPTTADEILEQRIQDCTNTDMRIKHRFENIFKQFLAYMREQREYENGTLQSVYASVRSFFDCHYYPLIMRKKDYPKATANGVLRANKDIILKIIAENNTTLNAKILTAKDTGLRVSDLISLNCEIILNNPDKDFIPITLKTQKTGYLAKTFLGTDAINALKLYIKKRQEGTNKIKPEIITGKSPLFATAKGKRLSRETLSNNIKQAFQRYGKEHMSAHSLRKKLQTDLEKAHVNTNWIDQMLGHRLINSRDAYSLPTDEELQEAYAKAYQYIKVYPEINTPTTVTQETPKQATTPILTQVIAIEEENYPVAEARNMTEVKALLAKGYKYEMDFEGVKLFSRK